MKAAQLANLTRLQRATLQLQQTGSVADLDEAIDASQQLLAAIRGEDARRAAVMINLGAMLRARFEGRGDPADVQQAVEIGEQAVAQTPLSGGNRPAALSNLCAALVMRYRVSGLQTDLDRAIEVGEQAQAIIPADSSDRVIVLSNLSAALKTKFESVGSAVGVDRAIEVGEQALAAMPAGHHGLPAVMTNLCIALRARFDRTGDMASLDRAIEIGEEGVAATPDSHPDRATFLNNLGRALAARYDRAGNAADGERAIAIGEQAVAAVGSNHPDRPMMLANLSSYLSIRLERTGDKADLDRAVALAEQAVAGESSGHPVSGRPTAAAASALLNRYKWTGAAADLDAAIDAGERAVSATPPDGPEHPAVLSNLSIARRARFERAGNMADLDAAIEAGREAVDSFAADHPKRAGCLSNLGGALAARYERTGARDDLDQAIEVTEQALAASPEDDPLRAAVMSNLGVHLAAKFERTGALTDLNRAIEMGELALAATPHDQPDYPRRQSNLAADLQSRSELTRSAADLDRAIELGEQAVMATQPGSIERAAFLSNLGLAHQARFRLTSDEAALGQAIEVSEQALAATPPDHPDRPARLCNLGSILWTRYKRTGVPADRDRIIELSREGAAVKTAAPSERARAAQLWGDFAAAVQDWAEASEGYAAAVALLALVAPRSLGRSDQEYWLSKMSGLAEQAAACCLQDNQLHKAVELWEQGRGVLLGQALDARTDLTALAERHPPLADEFSRIRDDLAYGDGGGHVRTGAPPAALPGADQDGMVRDEIDRRRRLVDELDHVLEEIRSQPGFERFLLPLPVSDLLPAAGSGPVVLVNASDIRSDAVILRPTGAEWVPLPALTAHGVHDQVAAFLSALEQVHAGAVASDRRNAEDQLSALLRWLWTAVAAPVLDRLGIAGPPGVDAGWPRLWWCPSGLLALLPLHAAGDHSTRFDPAPQTVLDRVVSSYTPTVRALLHARRPLPVGTRPAAANQLLVVAMPHTPGAGDLPGAAAEVSLVNARFPDQATVLAGPEATYSSVTEALPRCPWVHFACHAVSDLADPSASYLLLSDHLTRPLTVLDLAQQDLDGADLAFLSACATARTGHRLADEAIQLAAGFQLAGYRHVVATLWPIGDLAAVRVAGDFYDVLAADDAPPAVALHHSACRSRRLTPRQPSAWAAHMHSGA
jgi:hypothetical protein